MKSLVGLATSALPAVWVTSRRGTKAIHRLLVRSWHISEVLTLAFGGCLQFQTGL